MHYEVVFFDLGGVVVDVDSDRLMLQVSQLTGKTLDEVQAAIYNKELMVPFETGHLSPKQFYEGLKNRLNLSWSYEVFEKTWSPIFTEKKDVTHIMSRLRKYHRLVTLSNTNVLHVDWLQKNIPSLTMLFHDWVTSCDSGFRKPDRRIYEAALHQAGVRADKAVYIDDRSELVDAGRSYGIQSVRFESSQQLERDLQAIGLNL